MEDHYESLSENSDFPESPKLKSVLVIDDDAGARYLHQYLIKELEITENTVDFDDARKALEYLDEQWEKGQFPELILVDVHMPGMDGLDFLNNYKAKGYDQKTDAIVVVLTISVNPEELRQVWKTKFALYMPKPLNEEELREFVNMHFKQKKGRTLPLN